MHVVITLEFLSAESRYGAFDEAMAQRGWNRIGVGGRGWWCTLDLTVVLAHARACVDARESAKIACLAIGRVKVHTSAPSQDDSDSDSEARA